MYFQYDMYIMFKFASFSTFERFSKELFTTKIGEPRRQNYTADNDAYAI